MLYKWYTLAAGKHYYIPVSIKDNKVWGFAIYTYKEGGNKAIYYPVLKRDLKDKNTAEVNDPESFKSIIRLMFKQWRNS